MKNRLHLSRRIRIGLAVSVILLLGGVASSLILDSRVSSRLHSGMSIQSRVVGVSYFLPGRGSPGFQRVTVQYHVGAEDLTATLMAAFDFGQRYAVGDEVTLYISRSDHHEVATEAGYASEDWLMLLPSATISVGGLLAINFLFEFVRALRRRKR